MIVFISCGKAKLDRDSKAIDLYVGRLFKKKLAYALRFYPDSNIYILSAKHGLIPGDQVISPYDQVLPERENDEVREWSNRVIAQLGIFDSKEPILFLGNPRYFLPLDSYFTGTKLNPLNGLPMGRQIEWLHHQVVDSYGAPKQRKLF